MTSKTNNHSNTEQFVAVENIKSGEFVRRNDSTSKTYKRGKYDPSTKKYSLDDCDDISREIQVKRGTKLFVGFSY